MTLLRIVGDGPERLVELRQAKLQIGRARANDIVLPEAEKGVSRTHAELRYENGRYVIVDLQSQNGTWVDGKRVERAEVPIGSEIVLGEYRLYLELGTASAVLPQGREPGTGRAAIPGRGDELRIREESVTRELPVSPRPTVPAATGVHTPRWVIGAGVAAAALVVLAVGFWMLRSEPAPSSSGQQLSPSPQPTDPGPGPAGSSGQLQEPASASPDRDVSARNAPSPASPRPSAQDEAASRRRTDVGPATVPVGGDGTRVRRKPSESVDQWRSRAAALETRYGFSTAALERGDFAAAAGGFEAILLEEPGFRDAPQLLVQAQAGLRASARTLAESGDRLDAAGDWLGAVQKYEQARQVYSGVPGLDARLRRVRAKLRAEGTSAFNLAREHEANGRIDDAVKEYEKAVQWLPEQDPNRQIARARLEQLKRS